MAVPNPAALRDPSAVEATDLVAITVLLVEEASALPGPALHLALMNGIVDRRRPDDNLRVRLVVDKVLLLVARQVLSNGEVLVRAVRVGPVLMMAVVAVVAVRVVDVVAVRVVEVVAVGSMPAAAATAAATAAAAAAAHSSAGLQIHGRPRGHAGGCDDG